ncbi:MAG: hypothetical protein K1X83_10035 [Oligoflexia bacterium]|nr:hypothetical protein [Oligoflexia bacterium]
MFVKKFTHLALSAALVAGFAVSAIADEAPVQPGPVLQENVPGSFLVFPKFDIRGESSTQLRIVNNGYHDVDVLLNYVCPGVKHVNDFCASLNTEVSFTPHQTRVIDVADQHPPCNQGYVVAIALGRYNKPASYNYLTGSYHVYNGRRHEAENAIAIQSVRAKGDTLGSDNKLYFGNDYTSLSSNLYTDFRAVSFGGEGEADEGSRLTLLTLDVLAGQQNPAALAFIDFWNSAEVPFSTSVEFICWTERQLDTIDANFLEDNLGTTYGSMKIVPYANCPIPGGCPPMNFYTASMLGAIEEYGDGTSGGRTLFHDTTPKSAVFMPR